MSKTKKPREWYRTLGYLNEGGRRVDYETVVHVIEYSAYTKLQDRVKKLEDALNKIGIIGSGPKAYTSDFTTKVMGIVREVLK